MIIGITGTNGSGKGTIVKYLEENGFRHFSARKLLLSHVKEGQPANRDTLIVIADKLRKEHGPSYIAETLFEQAQKYPNAVIESLRAIGEIEALREKGNFMLLAIDADQKTRYDRICARKSATDHITFKEFCKQEDLEMNNNEPFKQNISACIKLADMVLTNEGTIQELREKLDQKLIFQDK
jgi:dephospho-CoA kinase